MMLQTILFGTWFPPETISSRVHRVGISGGHRYIPPKPHHKTNKDERGLNLSEQKVLNMMQRTNKPQTSATLSSKVKLTTNHCGIILGNLHKHGFLERKKTLANGTRCYVYSIKETACL